MNLKRFIDQNGIDWLESVSAMIKCPYCKQGFGANEIGFEPFSDEMGDARDFGVYKCPRCHCFLAVGEGESDGEFG
jgi:phage FluMu protein Com